MKYLGSILIVLISFLLITCNKDDDILSGNANIIIQDSRTNAAIQNATVQLLVDGNLEESYSYSGFPLVIEDLAVGTYTIKVNSDGYEELTEVISIRQNEDVNRIFLLNQIPYFEGIVQYNGQPVANANVLLVENNEQAVVNANGIFEFKNLSYSQAYTVRLQAPGFKQQEFTITIDEYGKNQGTFNLQLLRAISGVVTDNFGNPLADVRVQIANTNYSTFTETTGSYQLPGLEPSTYQISFIKDRYATAIIELTVTDQEDKLHNQVLQGWPVVSGQVVDSEKQLVIPQSEVVLRNKNTNTSFITQTNQNGNFSFSAVEPGPYAVTVQAPFYEQRTVDLALNYGDNEVLTIDLDIENPVLTVSATVFDFGDNQSKLVLEVSNTGESPLLWEATKPDNLTWLDIVPRSGQLNVGDKENVEIEIDRNAIVQGTFNAFFSLVSPNNGGQYQINVLGEIKATLSVSVDNLNFGLEDTQEQFSIFNTQLGIIDYVITASDNWMTVSPRSGSVNNNRDFITVSVNRTNLMGGDYTGTIAIDSDGGKKDIAVTMTVRNTEGPQLSIPNQMLDFGSELTTVSTIISNIGVGSLQWQVTDLPNWLVPDTLSGTLNENETRVIGFSVDRKSLAPGTYNENMQISSNGGSALIAVSIQIPAEPILSIPQRSLKFGPNESSQILEIINEGNAILNWEIEIEDEWLSANSVVGSNSKNIIIAVDKSNLDFGKTNTTFLVNSNGGSIPVEVEVSKSPQAPDLVLSTIRVKDDDNEGTVSIGDEVELEFTIDNISDEITAENLILSLTSNIEEVEFEQVPYVVGDIEAEARQKISFITKVSDEATENTTLEIIAKLIDAYDNEWTTDIRLLILVSTPVSRGLISFHDFNDDLRPLDDLIGDYNILVNSSLPDFQEDEFFEEGRVLSLSYRVKHRMRMLDNPLYRQDTFTISYWVKFLPSASDAIDFVFMLDEGFANYINKNGFSISIGNCYGDFSTSLLRYGSWRHIVLIYDGEWFNIYINGTRRDKLKCLSARWDKPGKFYLGYSRYDDSHMTGLLNNFRIYNRALSRKEIRQLYELRQ